MSNRHNQGFSGVTTRPRAPCLHILLWQARRRRDTPDFWKENVFSFEGRHVYYCIEIAKGLAHDAKPDDNNRVLLEHQPSNFLNSSKQQYQTRAQ